VIVAPGGFENGFVTVANPTAAPMRATLRFRALGGNDAAVHVTGREVEIPAGAEAAIPYTVAVSAGAPRAEVCAHTFVVELAVLGDVSRAATPARAPDAARPRGTSGRLVTYVEDHAEE
jgi:hypothetical protein